MTSSDKSHRNEKNWADLVDELYQEAFENHKARHYYWRSAAQTSRSESSPQEAREPARKARRGD